MAKQKELDTATPLEVVETPPPASARESLDHIAATLAASMPDVQPGAVQMERDAKKNISEQVDADGTKFDASIHAADDDGTPKLTLHGRFAKKRARDKKSATKPAESRLGTGTTKVDPKAQADLQARAAGTVAARSLIMLGIVLGGDEWQPMRNEEFGLDEAAQLDKAFGEYFAAKGWTDIPPGWALSIAIGGYALPRFFMPKTRSRLQRAKDWVAAKWIKWRAKKNGVNVDVSPAK